jgi:large repetitive protein
MKRSIFFASLFFWLTLAIAANAQEICNNGIDDDNDGFVDCFDKKCATNSLCDGAYIGNDALCEAPPSKFPAFKMKLDWGSPNNVTTHQSRLSIGDLDRDGIPEVVVTNGGGGSDIANGFPVITSMYVLRGSNGSIKFSNTSLPFVPNKDVALANIDNDKCAEIFVAGKEGKDFYIYSYNCDLSTQLWRSKRLSGDPGLLGLADFNGDGKTELYYKGTVLNANTGAIIAVGPGNFDDFPGSSVAVDIVGDKNLEIVTGLTILTVNIGAGTITTFTNRSEYFQRHSIYGALDGNQTSVADFNLDGKLDVIASGSNGKADDNTTIFFWNVAANTIKTYIDLSIPGDVYINPYCNPPSGLLGRYYETGWANGTGRINIADADGDGKLNAVYNSGKYLYNLKETATGLDTLWRRNVFEETSGVTGCTMFDFNGDGKTEVVYRDEQNLYIIDGTNGKTFTSQTCVSRTATEYPIVADVDADGESEICVTCGFDNKLAWDNFCNLPYSRNSQVRVYKTDLEPWVPARRLWNQHAYFNVNINDDLTIPKEQQKQQLVFSNTKCDGSPGQVRPLNSFLNQSPFLSSRGCPKYAAPDLAYVPNSVIINQPTCPNQNFNVSFKIENKGDVPISGNIPISFYKGNPLAAGALKLNTITVNLVTFAPTTQFTVNTTVTGDGSNFTLYVAINDSGLKPTPIVFPNTSFIECNYDNVFSTNVIPLPAPITAVKIQDNLKCTGSTAPDNGAVRAFVPVGATENTTDYDFFWSIGNVAKATPDFTGAIYSNLKEGTYTVIATHKTAKCSSAATQVVVNRVDQTLVVKIKSLNPYDNCKTPNGKLEAEVFVNGSATPSPSSNFTFAWYDGNDVFTSPLIGINSIVANLLPSTYTVLVKSKTGGCENITSQTVMDNTVKPVPATVVTDVVCTSLNSGSIKADVGGNTTNFTFNWYNGAAVKPTPDFTGPVYSGLTAGKYTLSVVSNATGCISVPITKDIVSAPIFTVTATATAAMTSCNSATPNGSASANVGGVTVGYIFDWFKGQNTLLSNKVFTGASATGLAAGIYTVKATSGLCSATNEVTINFAVVTPVLTIGAVNAFTSCTTPNGSITVNVSPDTPADYTFTWYKGSVVKAVSDFPSVTTNVLSGLPVGTYTVKAKHNTKNCEALPVVADIIDNTPIVDIQQVAALTELPTDCKATNGAMTITISAPGNTLGFDVEWFKNNTIAIPPIDRGVTSTTRTGLVSASYKIKATNLNNGCKAEKTFNLPYVNPHKLDIVSATDAITCSPKNEGSMVVKLSPAPPNPAPPFFVFTVTDYSVLFFDSEDVSGAPILTVPGGAGAANGDGTSNFTRNLLTPGFYSAVAIETNPLLSGCTTPPVTIEVKDKSVLPVITASAITNNTNCAGVVLPNGQIVAVADASAPAGYSFNWFKGADITSPPWGTTIGTNNNTADKLDAGPYTVEVTNTATQCKANATFSIFNNPPPIVVISGDIAISDLTNCTISNGSAQVVSIAPNTIADYAFEWFNSASVSLGMSNPLPGLSNGTYYVKAKNNLNNCASEVIEFEIKNKTIGTVDVTLANFTSPTRCLKPVNVLGEFVTVPSGKDASGATLPIGSFTTKWYLGNTATGIAQGTNSTLSGISITSPATSITYTVEVTNTTNNCTAKDTYVMPFIVSPITMTTSSSPMTSCISPDGSVFASVTSGSSNDYTYEWSIGNVVKSPADFTGKLIGNLPNQSYIVVATDNLDSFCKLVSTPLVIDDARVNPTVVAMQVSPVTSCDPLQANGSASASVDGQVTNHTFRWFAGTSATGTAIYTGVQVSNLSIGTYTVEATDNITGCVGIAQVTIKDGHLPIPLPDITILQNVTECDKNTDNQPGKNGILLATVGGETKDYTFEWFNPSNTTTTADDTNSLYDSLAIGTYTVVATSRITSCKSAPVKGQIIPDLQIPDFEVDASKATCSKEDGSASIRLTTNTDIGNYVWSFNGSSLSAGPTLQNAGEGVYTIRVTTSLGCFREKTVPIGTEIRPRNGISRNGDLLNDKFYINCIDSYERNNVKIFNRAGTLVYEANGYNNTEVFFDGESNRGVNPLGTHLPSGTYFYVVDKNDGSKPLAGYLEIVN